MAGEHVLSDQALSQCLTQIRQIPPHDADILYLALFIKRVEHQLGLYPTNNSVQSSIIYGTLENLNIGSAQHLLMRSTPRGWTDLKDLLLGEYNTQTPIPQLLIDIYKIKYSGNLRKFVDDLEIKSFIICNTLH